MAKSQRKTNIIFNAELIQWHVVPSIHLHGIKFGVKNNWERVKFTVKVNNESSFETRDLNHLERYPNLFSNDIDLEPG